MRQLCVMVIFVLLIVCSMVVDESEGILSLGNPDGRKRWKIPLPEKEDREVKSKRSIAYLKVLKFKYFSFIDFKHFLFQFYGKCL